MSNEVLSQDEINALLEDDNQDEVNNETRDLLNELEKDAIGEISNISMGSAATALYGLLDKKVEITAPRVGLSTVAELVESYTRPCVIVDVQYVEGLQGSNQLILEEKDAAIITDLMMGGDGQEPPEELGELHISAVSEAMNQMMGSASTSMSDFFEGNKINISPPKAELLELNTDVFDLEGISADDQVIQVVFDMHIGDLIDSQIIQVMTIDFAKKLVSTLMGQAEKNNHQQDKQVEAEQSEQQPMKQQSMKQQPMQQQPMQQQPMQQQPMQQQPMQQQPMQQQPMQQQPMQQQPMQQQPMQQQPMQQQPMQQQPMQQQPMQQQPMQQQRSGQNVEVQEVEFNQLGGTIANGLGNDIGLIYDVPLELTVRLGKTRMSIKDILELGPGSVIELDRLAGEAVDLLVNGKLIAKGEVVVIDENFGFRVTDIVSSEERLQKL